MPASPSDIKRGLDLRRRMFGEGPAIAPDDPFARYHELADRLVFPECWLGEALDLKTRTLCTLAVMVAFQRQQIRNHIRAALVNGISKAEIAEVIIQMAFYAGWPVANTAVSHAKAVFAEWDAQTDIPEGKDASQ